MRMTFEVVTDDALRHISEYMEHEDKVEIRKSLGVTPYEGLIISVASSDVERIVMIDGVPAGIFGFANEDDVICPWAFFTPLMRKYPKALLKGSKEFIQALDGFGKLAYGLVDAHNMRSIRWLAKIGFHFKPGTKDVNGFDFKEFFRCVLPQQQ